MTSFLNMQDVLLREIALSNNSDARTAIKAALNRAKSYVWNARDWRERKSEAILTTTAPYSTGTVTTDGTTSVAGSGTTWATSPHAGMKFALGLSSPWYTIATVDSTTGITLDRPVLEADVSGSAYIIFQDEYSLASDLATIKTRQMTPMISGYDRPMKRVEESTWLQHGVLPRNQGKPTTFRMIGDSTAVPSTAATRVQVWPVPDAAYAFAYEYLRKPATLSSNDDESEVELREELRYLIIQAARPEAYRYNNEIQRALLEEGRIDPMISKAYADHQRSKPRVVVRGGVDARDRRARGLFRFTTDS